MVLIKAEDMIYDHKKSSTNETIIKVENISAGYSDRKVIYDINLDINKLDFMGIIGPNGGGKSTFVKTLLGLVPIYDGKINFYRDNKLVDHLKIGYLPQRNSIDNKFPITVFDVILSGLFYKNTHLRKISKGDKERVQEILNLIGLEDISKNHIEALSGGQMQRVLLGRAIINRPEVLILDEPNSYIDKRFEERLYDILRNLNKTTTILIVSHEVTSLVDMVNRTINIDGTLKDVDLTCPYNHHH